MREDDDVEAINNKQVEELENSSSNENGVPFEIVWKQMEKDWYKEENQNIPGTYLYINKTTGRKSF